MSRHASARAPDPSGFVQVVLKAGLSIILWPGRFLGTSSHLYPGFKHSFTWWRVEKRGGVLTAQIYPPAVFLTKTAGWYIWAVCTSPATPPVLIFLRQFRRFSFAFFPCFFPAIFVFFPLKYFHLFRFFPLCIPFFFRKPGGFLATKKWQYKRAVNKNKFKTHEPAQAHCSGGSPARVNQGKENARDHPHRNPYFHPSPFGPQGVVKQAKRGGKGEPWPHGVDWRQVHNGDGAVRVAVQHHPGLSYSTVRKQLPDLFSHASKLLLSPLFSHFGFMAIFSVFPFSLFFAVRIKQKLDWSSVWN